MTGIVVGIACILSALFLLLLFRYRQRRHGSNHGNLRPYSVLYPDIAGIGRSHDAPADNGQEPTKARQEYLQNELQAAQDKITHLRNQQRFPSQLRSLLAHNATSEAMRRMREQIAAQESQIRELQAQLSSPWALGLSDEPPPGYSEGVRTEL
ncbi:hypothetical protein FB45DRAFT_864587 [Roridomyces roridus]|uniref:Uncharacterized protein n=1 Tax=Roridomyces roridus TaxID=1738132 RepID=A0AAD7BB48_9AGAR|nr:hypothetical protein FB45DRAFT_873645 [Roridomyces roridus]KAJ7636559.1 hypothetical protein FB45DRAFT_864587 [Roridomyces roridus]